MKPVLINGVLYSWNSIQFVLFGVPLVGVTEINYRKAKESKNLYGAGGEPIGWADGAFTYDNGSITVYKEEIDAIQKFAPNKSILEIPPFTATVIYSGDGLVFDTHKLGNIRFTSDEIKTKQGDTGILCTLTFSFAGLTKL